MAEGLYAGLPPEFRSPSHAAERIANLETAAERLALLARIPRGWHAWIVHEATIAIALQIIELPEKADRQDALAAVPEDWREDARWHALRLWRTRDIRAQYQAELAARRAGERERAAA